MGRQIVLRLGQLVPVVLGITFINFMMLNLLPGNTALAVLGQNATKQSLRNLENQLNLNQPLLKRYGNWLSSAISGHLGSSMISREPISKILGQTMPVTGELILLALLISIGVAIPVATISAYRRGRLFDIAARAISMAGLSLPAFIFGILLIFVFTVKLHLFPSTGFTPLSKGLWPNLRTMILPAVTMSAALFATYVRILRADIVEQLQNEDYVQTARAKGISEFQLLTKHVLRNSLFGLVTIIGVNIGILVGATVIVESVFALPGMGQELVQSVNSRDVTVVEGLVLVIAVIVVISNLLADLLYALIDPRVRRGG